MAEIISTNKYLIKRKYKTINGTTYPMDEYQVILYEAESEDCGFIRPQYQWSATTGYLCDYVDYTKYAREVYMVSYDSGATWAVDEPVQERRGEVIEYNSYDCGKPMYRCVETMETGCVMDDFKLALYGNDNSLLFANECDASSSITKSEWSGEVAPSSIYRADISECATSIGTDCFSGCTSLSSVNISNSVTSIGIDAFRYCSSLTSITIPNSVKSIGYDAFYGCSSLSSVNISNSVKSIGYEAFKYCTSLKSVTIPSSVTSIGTYAFADCSSLTSINIPSGVTSIGSGAFAGCDSLTSMTVDSNNTVYDSRNNCNAIIKTNTLICGCKNTIIPSGVTSIDQFAFQGCTSLSSITIPNSVTSIGFRAFNECSGLTDVEIGNGVTSIGNYAFQDCSSLTSVTIGSGITSVGQYVFSGCTNIRLELDAITVEKWFSGSTEITTLILGNDVTSIGASAFTKCTNLTSVTIPDSVLIIDKEAFNHCSGLTTCTIGSGITSIGNDAFYYARRFTSIIIYATTPPTLGTSAFGSNNLTIYVPAQSVQTYKSATNWRNYASMIQAITT